MVSKRVEEARWRKQEGKETGCDANMLMMLRVEGTWHPGPAEEEEASRILSITTFDFFFFLCKTESLLGETKPANQKSSMSKNKGQTGNKQMGDKGP